MNINLILVFHLLTDFTFWRERHRHRTENIDKTSLFRWAVIKDFVDVFNNLSAPYFLAEGSLLNFHRNFSAGEDDVDFSLDLEWWKKSDHKSQLYDQLTKKGLWLWITFGEFGEVLIKF